MTKRGSAQSVRTTTPTPIPANDHALLDTAPGVAVPQKNTPANDNPPVDDLPACLAVTDDEVRLLHRYLGDQILALFR